MKKKFTKLTKRHSIAWAKNGRNRKRGRRTAETEKMVSRDQRKQIQISDRKNVARDRTGDYRQRKVSVITDNPEISASKYIHIKKNRV